MSRCGCGPDSAPGVPIVIVDRQIQQLIINNNANETKTELRIIVDSLTK